MLDGVETWDRVGDLGRVETWDRVGDAGWGRDMGQGGRCWVG